jgi:hypothetical protein
MGDRVYAAIRIGGHIETPQEAERLIDGLIAEGAKCQHTDERCNDEAVAIRLLRATVDGKLPQLCLHDDDVNYGEFPDIEDAIKEVPKLWCSTNYGAGCGFSEGIKTICHVDGKLEELHCGTTDHGPTVPLQELVSATEQPDEELAAIVRGIVRRCVLAAGDSLPPLTVSPAVGAWLKIFGKKAA